MSRNMSNSNKRTVTRTRTGCWTCRGRRKKCDEVRPFCNTCANLGLRCEGYGVRLRWTAHRKGFVVTDSRPGKRSSRSPRSPQSPQSTTNFSSPRSTTSASLPGKSTNANFVVSTERLLKYIGQESFDSLTEYERDVMCDFLNWGNLTLGSNMGVATEDDAVTLLRDCSNSKPLLINCLTYQITLDPKHAAYVDEYYSRSIQMFRKELSDPTSLDKANTCYAGVLLCSISMNLGMPWTIHLNGLVSILSERQVFARTDVETKEFIHLISTLDIPTHTLGRKTPQLNLWRDYNRSRDGIEDITGLPCSLMDLFSCIMEPDVEERLHAWPVTQGSPTQCKIWKANRAAAIISARQWKIRHAMLESDAHQRPEYQAGPTENGPAIIAVVQEILVIAHELRPLLEDKSAEIRRPLLYPLVAAGSQPSCLTDYDKTFIGDCIIALADGALDEDPYYGGPATVLRELWANGRGRSIEQVAHDLDMEMALF
ncbi:hypothetical protein BU24DRAFT_263196 [Aaosphaeria arxii CBS 175.79]|uniref:Zn(2)-C6 fungal-type domain-containing protein n=1 Tax=Aaosphaeria arxii CBS 175.79 TaxID=1450172 RepID=A0A6A5XJJ2_9PLEO|nr:uncharacterized protein BU24DRAFT_263196 [Aaosphaeria arxii CBS 175.79]KAF2013049.1 hypothetical protein BU24DRAFT_263196 [Aaosphaeria arxii CBS 175.79]